MNIITKTIIFLFINFGALYIGNIFQGGGPMSDWYQNLNIAPWTPPGWVFGAAWTTIMICFSIYLAKLWRNDTKLIILFVIQLVLNILWNPIFFRWHNIGIAMIVICLLFLLMLYFLITYRKEMESATLLLLPYVIWLAIACSLNGYALLNN